MNNPNALVASTDDASDEWEDMFSRLPQMDAFDLKKDQLAAEMAALMSFAGKNRSEMAESLNWEKSRVTRVLSGKANPTVKTIKEYCAVLGYDFDVIFRLPTEVRAKQPWQKASSVSVQLVPHRPLQDYEIRVDVQTASEVAIDLQRGHGKSHYISLGDARPRPQVFNLEEVGSSPRLSAQTTFAKYHRLNVLDVVAKVSPTLD